MAGKLINGCVFFICTAGFGCGSGKTVMRAVSFLGLTGGLIGAGIAAAAERGAAGASVGVEAGFGGRVGKWIRTVSRDSDGADEGELG